MYFKIYRPLSPEQVMSNARAYHTYNAVVNYCGVAAPTLRHYIAYQLNKMHVADKLNIWLEMDMEGDSMDECVAMVIRDECAAEWNAIKKAIDTANYVSNISHYVYFAVFNDGAIKCGQTNRLALRNSQLSTEHGGIDRMWYLELSSKEERKAAEHALHCFFDRCRLIDRIQGKQDWYQGEHDDVVEYIRWNKKKMYDAVMATVVG